MILTDKPYIETPPDDTPVMRYLSIYQLLSILNFDCIPFSSIPLYKDKCEASLSVPSYINVIEHTLLENNTPVKKDKFYHQRQKQYGELPSVTSLLGSGEYTLEDLDYYTKKFDRKIDTFAELIYSFVRHFMFASCWSEADAESILMWDRYGRLGSTVAIKSTIRRMRNAFTFQRFPMYIGKIQYKDYNTEHITGFDGYATKNLSDPNIIEELFYQPMFHKQKVYQDEKEIRVMISYEHFLKFYLGDSYFSDIPYYDKHWGLVSNPHADAILKDHRLRFISGDNSTTDIPRIRLQSIDTDQLIENIIISPYAEPYVNRVLECTAQQYDFDDKKLVNSSIQIR